MKFYKYKGEKSHSVTHILLENLEEVKLFLSNKDIFWQADIDNYIKMTLIEDKATREKMISHSSFRTPISDITAVMGGILFDDSGSLNPSYFQNMYNTGMIDFINDPRFDNVFVNRVGGYCNFEAFNKDDYIEVFGFSIEDLLNDISYSFNYNNYEDKFLILENDPVLDKWTTEHFNNRVIPYICNLRTMMKTNKFEELLIKFSQNYSKKIFVYTTGLDYEQMLEYTERAITCGFEEFEWVFNGFEREDEFKKFLDSFVKKSNITYKISRV